MFAPYLLLFTVGFTGRKIRYLTPILHLSVPDMCKIGVRYLIFRPVVIGLIVYTGDLKRNQ
jgi:hypothetical protein